MSRSRPDGRDEVGEGKRLDGAVGGDIPAEGGPSFGDVMEGSEGVEV